MILRIEDTDQKRTVDGAVENLQKMLTWAGIDIDEGPFSAGADSNAYGPFTQSERLDLYRDRAYELVDRGFAYPCFCTESRLNVMRHTQRSKGMGSTKYDRTCLGLDKNEFQTIEVFRKPSEAVESDQLTKNLGLSLLDRHSTSSMNSPTRISKEFLD